MTLARAPIARWAAYGLALLLPVSACWFVGPSLAPGVPVQHYARAGLYPSDAAVAVLLLTGLARRRLFAAGAGPGWVLVPLAGLAALALLTAATALSPPLAAYTAVRWLSALGVYLVLARTDVPVGRWIAVLVAGLVLQTCLGIGQVITQGPVGLPGELALPPHQMGAAVLVVSGRPWLRAYGLTFHPNVLGGYLVVGLLISLPLLERRWMRPLWWLLATGLLITFSRSAWLAAAVVLPLLAGWLAWRRPELRRGLVVTLGGAAVIGLVAAGVLGRHAASRFRPSATVAESRSLRERGELTDFAFSLIGERPLVGVGAGNFVLAAGRAERPMEAQPVHNVPLLLAAEISVLGAGLWYWLWLAPGLALRSRAEDGAPWSAVLTAAWFAWGIIALWDYYPWALNDGRLLGVTLLGLMARTVKAAGEGAALPERRGCT